MSKENSEFQRKLSKLGCPFTWKMDNVIPPSFAKQTYERKEEDDDDDEQYSSLLLNNMINTLMACYLEIENAMKFSEKKLKEAYKFLEKMRNSNSKEFDGTMRSFEHVFYATKCHILYKQGNVEEAEQCLQNLVDVSCMKQMERGALDGIKSAAWSLYSDFGQDNAVDFARRAIELNPENSFWHFNLAKNLRRQRRLRSISSSPGESEKESFEKAYQISENPYYGVYLAQMYRESLLGARNISDQDKKDTEKKVFDLYKKIMKSDNISHFVASRLTLGFTRINTINTRVEAEQCLNILQEKSEDDIQKGRYEYYKALYLEKFLPDKIDERLKCFQAAAEFDNFPADLRCAECEAFLKLDPAEHLLKMLSKYKNAPKEKHQTMYLALAACYYLNYRGEINSSPGKTEGEGFEKLGYLRNAAEYYLKALEIDPNGQKLKDYYKFGTFKPWKQSVYSFLINEFLPKLSSTNDPLINEMCSKIEQICQQYKEKDTASLNEHMQNMEF